MTKFDTRLKANIELWFENKKNLNIDDYEMLKKFTNKTELEG